MSSMEENVEKTFTVSDNYELLITDLKQNIDEKANESYEALPYMAPEILKDKSYTQASDIYSFSMIIWEFTSGISLTNNREASILEGERPKIIEGTPQCYVDLMKRCWDSDPKNKSNVIELEQKLPEWIICIYEYYRINKNGNDELEVPNVDDKLKNDMLEFVKANNALECLLYSSHYRNGIEIFIM
ncbi:kinase-like domain-containing protein [Rhizophagus clarus]|uniref:Kinase-like domain-containing protein n=1 Tax=Rhizophagus clarus TaxID=94130 RepID=A0A8H3QHH0_9GLOM|nr:kinase-like domain-containing protein [Rhizophagus clarus]